VTSNGGGTTLTNRDWLDYVTLATAVLSLVVALTALVASRRDRHRDVDVTLGTAYEADEQGRDLAPPVPRAFVHIVNKSLRPIKIMGMGFIGPDGLVIQVPSDKGLPQFLTDAENCLVGLDPATLVATYRQLGPLKHAWVFDSEGNPHTGVAIDPKAFDSWMRDVLVANVGKPAPEPWPVGRLRRGLFGRWKLVP
jgi:hypothetical protein